MREAASRLLSYACLPILALYLWSGYTEGRIRYELYMVHSQAIKMGLAELYYIGPGKVKWRWKVDEYENGIPDRDEE